MKNTTKESKRIKLAFNEKQYDEHQAKGIKAIELWELIKKEFQVIDVTPLVDVILSNENVFDYALDEYWKITKEQFPENVSSVKAIGLTDFNSAAVTRAAAELKTLKDFFVVEKNEIYSNIEMDKYWSYVAENKENEYLKLTKIIADIKPLVNNTSWIWDLQKVFGSDRVLVVNGECVCNEYYFSR